MDKNVIVCEGEEGASENKLSNLLCQFIDAGKYDRIFVLTDEHTHRLCYSSLSSILSDSEEIVIGAEDVNKNINTLSSVWQALSEKGATRHSLLINLGGGMITDLGGFAASTFKRGIHYVNIPTTLLAMVDASVGGKTGINFNGLKNEIGVFNAAKRVYIETNFLKTLDQRNILSGYAEMLKHGLISDTAHWAALLNFDMDDIDYHELKQLVVRSIQVKENIVEQDPHEKGIRKALNFGHTLGHAFESLALKRQRPILHGYAVAYGMVGELYQSCIKTGFPREKMHQTIHFIKENYGIFDFNCKDYEQLYEFMLHDKKNSDGIINFTLLHDIGEIEINQQADKDSIFEMMDFCRECME
jgi:3-dehydroquinate synthase